jgi:hypothetical protein
LLPKLLGTSTGAKTLSVGTALTAVRVLSQDYYGTADNGITKLYAQLLGAKLNQASGASTIALGPVLYQADMFLAGHNYQDWSLLTAAEQTQVLEWHYTLDQYNNGLVGPGHCN